MHVCIYARVGEMIVSYQRFVSFLIALVSLIVIAFSVPSSPLAAEKTVLIVKIENSEQSEFASKLYRTVVEKISAHLEEAGFQTLNDVENRSLAADSNASLSDSDFLAKMRNEENSNVHYVAFVQIVANTILLQEGTRIDVEISGRMLDVTSGSVLARFELPVPAPLNAPPACDLGCIIQLLEDNTAFLANGLGRVLTQRLQKSK